MSVEINAELDADITLGLKDGLIDATYLASQLGQPASATDLHAIFSDPATFVVSPSAAFDSAAYLERYPDIADGELHPVIHYLRHGKAEGRWALPVFQSVLDAIPAAHKPIWIETHELSYTGAPTALLHILQGLDARDMQLGAPMLGPLSDSFAAVTGPIVLHGQAAGRITQMDQVGAMQARCAQLLGRAGAAHVIANSFLAWPMVLGAQQLGLPCTWIIHEPDGDEMAAQTPAPLFDLLRAQMAQVEKLIFVSASSRDAWGMQGHPKAEVIPKALPPTPAKQRDFGRSAAGCGQGDILLLSVGTASPRKGQADLVGALEHLADQGATENLIAVMVGYVDTPYASDLRKRLAAMRNRGLRVKFLRQSIQSAERANVETLFAAADIFIMSSRAESLPLTTAEALAAGCPVISTDIPGIAEMVTHGQTGLLYPAGDSQTLAQHIRHLAQSPELRAQMRRTIAARSNHHAYPDMINAYRKALK